MIITLNVTTYEPIGLVVMKSKEPLSRKKTTCDASEREGNTTFMGQRDISCDFVAEKDKCYVLLPCTFNTKVEQPYEIIIYSQRTIKLAELSK